MLFCMSNEFDSSLRKRSHIQIVKTTMLSPFILCFREWDGTKKVTDRFHCNCAGSDPVLSSSSASRPYVHILQTLLFCGPTLHDLLAWAVGKWNCGGLGVHDMGCKTSWYIWGIFGFKCDERVQDVKLMLFRTTWKGTIIFQLLSRRNLATPRNLHDIWNSAQACPGTLISRNARIWRQNSDERKVWGLWFDDRLPSRQFLKALIR